jgi:hypothetical protein
MTSQASLGWSMTLAGAILFAGAGIVWLCDPVTGFADSIYGVVSYLPVLSGISMFLGGIWIATLPASTSRLYAPTWPPSGDGRET